MNVFRHQQQPHQHSHVNKQSTSSVLSTETTLYKAPSPGVIQTTVSSGGGEMTNTRARKSPRANVIKNRKIMNAILKYVGHQVNKDLSLCGRGICYFQCNQFMIVIKVPEKSDSVFLHSMVFGLGRNDNRTAIFETCMKLNYMQQLTRGSTLGLNDGADEMNLCYSCPVAGLTRDSFVEALENFIVTALQVNQQMELIR